MFIILPIITVSIHFIKLRSHYKKKILICKQKIFKLI